MVTIDQLAPPPEVEIEQPAEPEVIALDNAGDLFETLSSDIRREILDELGAQPTNAATLAGAIDTSVQNVLYHLDRLREAGLVRVAGTHYSSKGKEMRVYAPTGGAIVIDVAREESPTAVQTPRGTAEEPTDGRPIARPQR